MVFALSRTCCSSDACLSTDLLFWYPPKNTDNAVYKCPLTPCNANCDALGLCEVYPLIVESIQQLQEIALIAQPGSLLRKLRLIFQNLSYLLLDQVRHLPSPLPLGLFPGCLLEEVGHLIVVQFWI